MRGQAVEVAERMGIIARVRAAAIDVIGTSFVDSANRSVARIDMQAIQRKYGSGEVEILRGDLAAILNEATKDGDHRAAFRRYGQGHRPLAERSQSNLFTGLVAPNIHAGIWARNTMARLPLVSALAGLERRLQPKAEPLPDYARPRHAAGPA